MEDMGMLVYHYEKSKPKENYLELKFCVSRVMCIAARKIPNVICASSAHQDPAWKEWKVWM